MSKTLPCKIEPDKTNRRIPHIIADNWDIWCKKLNSQNSNNHISKSDLATAAYLILMDYPVQKISDRLDKISSLEDKQKQISVIIPKDISEKWTQWCSELDQHTSKGCFTAAAFELLMEVKEDLAWDYINKARQDQVITEEIAPNIAQNIVKIWDDWCEKILAKNNVNKGTLTAAALTKLMDSSEREIYLYIAPICNSKENTRQVKATIPNYVKEQWVFWCGKTAFDLFKSKNELISKSTFFAAALTMLMDTKIVDIQKYISYTYSKDNYNYEILIEDRQEMLELLAFALAGKLT